MTRRSTNVRMIGTATGNTNAEELVQCKDLEKWLPTWGPANDKCMSPPDRIQQRSNDTTTVGEDTIIVGRIRQRPDNLNLITIWGSIRTLCLIF